MALQCKRLEGEQQEEVDVPAATGAGPVVTGKGQCSLPPWSTPVVVASAACGEHCSYTGMFLLQ